LRHVRIPLPLRQLVNLFHERRIFRLNRFAARPSGAGWWPELAGATVFGGPFAVVRMHYGESVLALDAGGGLSYNTHTKYT
jgi:hypothetical protein